MGNDGYDPGTAQGYGQQPYGTQPYGTQPYGTQPYGDVVQPYGATWTSGHQPTTPMPQPMPYGYPAPGYPPYAAVPPQPANGMGIAGFVTGLVGLVLFWIPLIGLLIAGAGIVLSAMGMSRGRRTGASTGLAIAGLVCGIVGAVPGLFVFLSWATFSSGF